MLTKEHVIPKWILKQVHKKVYTVEELAKKVRLPLSFVRKIVEGSPSSWINLTTACCKCNAEKGPKLLPDLNMNLKRYPYEPEWARIRFPTKVVPVVMRPAWEMFFE